LPALSLRGFPLSFSLGNTSCSVRDPELDQSSHTRDCEQSPGRKQPAANAAAREPSQYGPQHRAARAHQRDHVPHPVNEIEERTFWLLPRLTLRSYVESWVLSQVRGQTKLHSQHGANRTHCQWLFERNVLLRAHEWAPPFRASVVPLVMTAEQRQPFAKGNRRFFLRQMRRQIRTEKSAEENGGGRQKGSVKLSVVT